MYMATLTDDADGRDYKLHNFASIGAAADFVYFQDSEDQIMIAPGGLWTDKPTALHILCKAQEKVSLGEKPREAILVAVKEG